MTNPDAFFGGAPGLSWPKATAGVYSDTRLKGVIRGGLIVDEPQVLPMTEMGTGKPITWADGRPKEQLVVTLLCDGRGGALREADQDGRANDDGRRRLYVRGYMVAAVREALQAAGAPGLRQGGELYVAWVSEKPSKTQHYDPARVWAAKYVAPSVELPRGAPGGQPASGLSGQPANPFGAPVPAQQPATVYGDAYNPAMGKTANPFGQPAAAAPTQQPAAAGGPAHNPFG